MADRFQAFYTKSNKITDFMVERLNLQENENVLEPCGGDGEFVDSLLKTNKKFKLDTCDLNPIAAKGLKEKYKGFDFINVRETDTLIDDTFDKYCDNPPYDKIIGNPPYGAWMDYDHRDFLKNKYKGFYVGESYALFIIRCVNMLKNGGVLSFIIPDTYMFLHLHVHLREFLLRSTKINEILTFPSKFFPGVNFGYSNLSILTLTKCDNEEDCLANEVIIYTNLKTDDDLIALKNYNIPSHVEEHKLKQTDVLKNPSFSFLLNSEVSSMINSFDVKLGDIADCVTGIYTGDNKKYMKVSSSDVRNSKGYPVVLENELSDSTDLNGVDGENHFIEIIKSSSETKYLRFNHPWYIDWSKEAIHHYNNNKKARFQNSGYYFKKGIAIPMVKSSKINATIIKNLVFDQSIVGIFPRDDKYFNYLLGFMNSEVANKIIHIINPSANNSANYLKKIPIIIDEDIISKVSSLVQEIIDDYNVLEVKQKQINRIFDEAYNI